MRVAISGDKPGRTVTVERVCDSENEDRITLGVGGLIGQEEWTFLSDDEALTIGTALINECREQG